MAASSSSSSRSWKYDVFLSFRGEDTRKTFVDHLYSALVDRLVSTYKDDQTLLRGDTIGPSLLNAIEESQIAIIVFSANYANSSWCLDELEYIMKCKEERGLIVMPIFYHVEPTDVRKQKRKYEEAFAKHESDNNNSKIESWRNALVAATNIAGWEISHNQNGYEAKCIKDIVGTILDKLLYSNSVVDESLVGMGTRLQDLKLQLKIGSGGVRMVGIWGIGGGGKTTLATSLYVEMSGQFDSCCFLGNIKEESTKSNGMETLQEKILSTLLKTEVKVESVDIGKHTIKSRLGRKKVLIVLDDVDDRKQLEALVGSHNWFGDGSRIIITTRDEHLLRAHNVDKVSHVILLSDDEAVRLFNKHAYNDNNLVEDYEMLSELVVSYASGLPLALKVLGSFLCDKDKDEWMSTLSRLGDIPEMEIVKILKISYDGLTPLEKELFLDIVCFWRGKKKDEAMEVLDACGFHPIIGVKVLIQKSLISISSSKYDFDKHDVFEMHDLVQEMGHYIVRGEHPNNPEKHSRLWRIKDIKDICYNGNATMENNITEAIICYECPSSFGSLVSKVKKLRLLSVRTFYKDDIEVPEYISNELRYMDWSGYPASPFPISFQPRKLVVLRLKYTFQEELWKGKKYLPCLKELEINDAINLVRTPDFGGLPCLEKLTLTNCWKPKIIEGNFHALKYLKNCVFGGFYWNLIKLPKDVFHEHSHLEELHLQYTRQPCNFFLPCSLRKFTLRCRGIEDVEIPFGIGELSNLQELDLSHNDFSRLNVSLLKLTRLKLLNLENCKKLVELPQLPTSIATLKADGCESLEVVGDIINTNCKWLSQVSIRKGTWTGKRVINGGQRLMETMLRGNAIENCCMILRLDGAEIPKGFRPRLVKGEECSLKLPENWFSHFSGFLFCVTVSEEFMDPDNYPIIMEHDNGGGMDCQRDILWQENIYDIDDLENIYDIDDLGTWVGYVPFGSLKHTLWWDPTSAHIHFSVYQNWSCRGIGVRLVSKTSETVSQLQATTDSFSYDDYKCNFIIHHDSKSHLKGNIRWSQNKKYLFP